MAKIFSQARHMCLNNNKKVRILLIFKIDFINLCIHYMPIHPLNLFAT